MHLIRRTFVKICDFRPTKALETIYKWVLAKDTAEYLQGCDELSCILFIADAENKEKKMHWTNLQNLFCCIMNFLSFHVKTVCGMEEDRQSPWVKRFAHKCFIFTTICILIFTHICICLPWLKRSIQKCFIFTPTWWFLFVFAFAFVLVFSS